MTQGRKDERTEEKEYDMSNASALSKPAPWEHRRWRNGICRSRAQLGQAIAFFIVVAASAGFMAMMVIKSPDMFYFSKVRWEVLIPVGLTIFGGAFLIGALFALVRWIRFGRCFIKMHTVPGVIGGHFKGEIYLPESFPSETEVRMELFCESTSTIYRSGDNNDSTSIDHPWTKTLCITTNSGLCHDGYCVVPFDFKIPGGLSDETDSKRGDGSSVEVDWGLRVFAKMKGPDLDIRFYVPVFRTAASDPTLQDDPQTEKPLETYLHETGQKRRVRIEFENGATTYICDAMGMQFGVSILPVLFGALFLAGGLFAGFSGLPDILPEVFKPTKSWEDMLFRIIPLFMSLGLCFLTLVFTLVGLFIMLMGFSGMVSRRTWLESGLVRQRLHFLGIPWWRSCPVSCISDVGINGTTRSGSSAWYDVVIRKSKPAIVQSFPLCLLFGQLTVATNVPTEREAKTLINQLQKELRLPEERED
jgi:hypothetical protein